MRWKKKPTETWSIKPVAGDRRIVQRFLWLPKKLGEEWRWMERARIEEMAYKRNGVLAWSEVKFRN